MAPARAGAPRGLGRWLQCVSPALVPNKGLANEVFEQRESNDQSRAPTCILVSCAGSSHVNGLYSVMNDKSSLGSLDGMAPAFRKVGGEEALLFHEGSWVFTAGQDVLYVAESEAVPERGWLVEDGREPAPRLQLLQLDEMPRPLQVPGAFEAASVEVHGAGSAECNGVYCITKVRYGYARYRKVGTAHTMTYFEGWWLLNENGTGRSFYGLRCPNSKPTCPFAGKWESKYGVAPAPSVKQFSQVHAHSRTDAAIEARAKGQLSPQKERSWESSRTESFDQVEMSSGRSEESFKEGSESAASEGSFEHARHRKKNSSGPAVYLQGMESIASDTSGTDDMEHLEELDFFVVDGAESLDPLGDWGLRYRLSCDASDLDLLTPGLPAGSKVGGQRLDEVWLRVDLSNIGARYLPIRIEDTFAMRLFTEEPIPDYSQVTAAVASMEAQQESEEDIVKSFDNGAGVTPFLDYMSRDATPASSFNSSSAEHQSDLHGKTYSMSSAGGDARWDSKELHRSGCGSVSSEGSYAKHPNDYKMYTQYEAAQSLSNDEVGNSLVTAESGAEPLRSLGSHLGGTPKARSTCINRNKLTPNPKVAAADWRAGVEMAPSAEVEASMLDSEKELPVDSDITALSKGSISRERNPRSMSGLHQAESSLDIVALEPSAETAPASLRSTMSEARSKRVKRNKLMSSAMVAVADGRAEVEITQSAEIEASLLDSEKALPMPTDSKSTARLKGSTLLERNALSISGLHKAGDSLGICALEPSAATAPASLRSTMSEARSAPVSLWSTMTEATSKRIKRKKLLSSPNAAVANGQSQEPSVGGTYPAVGLVSRRIQEHQRFIESLSLRRDDSLGASLRREDSLGASLGASLRHGDSLSASPRNLPVSPRNFPLRLDQSLGSSSQI